MNADTPTAEPAEDAEDTATGSATYCPEDNKLRLYVGRVPRDEYLKLKAEGWQALHKQRETGGGDFAAVWTPGREDTALAYSGGVIDDEDMSPQERAADRAERFTGYRDRREGEAGLLADRFEAAPMIHGHQSAALAERRAAVHGGVGVRAVNVWEKAEYWQYRTAGVIAHALHVSAPGVRMGRIKTIEADQRKNQAERDKHAKIYAAWQKVAAAEGGDILLPLTEDGYADTEKLNPAQAIAYTVANSGNSYMMHLMHPDPEVNENGARGHTNYFHGFSPYDLLTHDTYGGGVFRRLTPHEVAAIYLASVTSPEYYGKRWADHYALRLAYENQMLESQGGRAAHVEMIPGGFLENVQIFKVNKSPATGRVVSVGVKVPKVDGWTYGTKNVTGTDYAIMTIETERLGKSVYRPPTDEEAAAFAALKKETKAKKAAVTPKEPPTLNPTDDDAEKLQAVWNADKKAQSDGSQMKRYGKIYTEYKPSTVSRMTQAQYSEASKGTYSRVEIREVLTGGGLRPTSAQAYSARICSGKDITTGAGICKVRTGGCDGSDYGAKRVIVLTDKPQKPFPAEVWAVSAVQEVQP